MSTLKVNDITEATSGGGKIWPSRAWLNMDGTGTISIRADGNFSSITDLGTGIYNATMSNAMSSANYSTAMQCSSHNGATWQNHAFPIAYTQGGIRRDPTTTVIYWHQVDVDGAAYRDTNHAMVQVTI